jgi:hypothetical protein
MRKKDFEGVKMTTAKLTSIQERSTRFLVLMLEARTFVCFVWQVVLHQASAVICFYDLKIC